MGMHACAILCRLIRAAEDGRPILRSTLEEGIEYFMVGLTGYMYAHFCFHQ